MPGGRTTPDLARRGQARPPRLIDQEELATADAGKGLLNGAPVVSEVGGGQFLAERPAWVFLPVGSRDEAFIDVDRPGPDHVGKGERRRTARFRAMA